MYKEKHGIKPKKNSGIHKTLSFTLTLRLQTSFSYKESTFFVS